MFEGVKGRRLLQVAVLSVALVGTAVPPVAAQSFFVTWQANSLARQVSINPAGAGRRIDRLYTRNPQRATLILGNMSVASANDVLEALYARNPAAAQELAQDLIDSGHPVSPWK